MKLSPEQLEALTPEQRADYESGNAVAVRVHQPVFTGTMFAIAAALIVAAALLPIWVPLSLLAYESMAAACLMWVLAYKGASGNIAFLRTAVDLERGMTKMIQAKINKAIETQRVSEGTKPATDGLTQNNEEEN